MAARILSDFGTGSRPLLKRIIAADVLRLTGICPFSTVLSTSSSSDLSKRRAKFTSSHGRTFFSKSIPPEAVGPVLFGTGFLGVVLGIAWWARRKESQYADPSYHPVYEKRPSPNSSATTAGNQASASNTSIPSESTLPSHVPHVIIGAGAAAIFAARAIRASDPLAKVLMIAGDESTGEAPIEETGGRTPPPYIRPLLSKGLWWRKPERRKQMLNAEGDIRKHSWLFYEPLSYFVEPSELDNADSGGVALLRNNRVTALDPDQHRVTLASGQSITYDCCLIATGSGPKRIPELELCSLTGIDLTKHERITYFRNLRDYRKLQALSDKLHATGGTIAVIGGGPLGSELAISIAGEAKAPKGAKVATSAEFSVIHFVRENAPLRKLLPPSLASLVTRFEGQKGVQVVTDAEVVRAALADPKGSPANGQLRLTIHKSSPHGTGLVEESLLVDHVVCVVGTEPRNELAASAGLELDPSNGGFSVNSELEARADVYVAGDAASYWDSSLRCRRSSGHLNFAEETGSLAGLNMAIAGRGSNIGSSRTLDTELMPAAKTYDPRPLAHSYQPSFWCSLGPGATWDAVGLIDSCNLLTRTCRLETPASGDETIKEVSNFPAVVFYLTPNERKLVGILLWNLPEDLYTDKEYAAPSRLNLARKLLQDQIIIQSSDGVDEVTQLTVLARQFDLAGEISESYAELKAFTEAKKLQLEEELAAAAAASTDEKPSASDKPDQKTTLSQPSDRNNEAPKKLNKPKEPVTSSP
uniref:Putative apoptosis-inducing factor 1 n=1 Tax=Schistocephalus solidus TaxID=70667 RepID=A0A0X3NIE3_SCHSO